MVLTAVVSELPCYTAWYLLAKLSARVHLSKHSLLYAATQNVNRTRLKHILHHAQCSFMHHSNPMPCMRADKSLLARKSGISYTCSACGQVLCLPTAELIVLSMSL